MSLNADWHIQPRATQCVATGHAFEEEEKIHSALFWRDGQYVREDYCAEAWAARNDNIAPISHWQHTFESPPPPPPEALRKDDAESLLKHLLAENDPAQRNARYILALMLERKKLLKPVDTQRRGEDTILIYEHTPSGDTWIVEDPGLRLDELEPVQDEVAALLASGGVSEPQAAEEEEEASAEEQAPAEDAVAEETEPPSEAEGEPKL